MHFELSSLTVWIALWIVSITPEFQVNILSNNRYITKCQFLHDKHNDNDNDATATAIPWVFSKTAEQMLSVWTWLKVKFLPVYFIKSL